MRVSEIEKETAYNQQLTLTIAMCFLTYIVCQKLKSQNYLNVFLYYNYYERSFLYSMFFFMISTSCRADNGGTMKLITIVII